MTVKLSVAELGDDFNFQANGSAFPAEPPTPIAEQAQMSFTTHAESSAFNAITTIVRLCADTACYVAFGTAPVATSASRRIPAGVVCYFRVPKGLSYKVSAYDGAA